MMAKRHNPRLKVVALVTYAFGDPGRLDVEGLSVNAGLISRSVDRAVRDPWQAALRVDGR